MNEAPKSLHQVLEEMGHVVDGEFLWPQDPARRCEVARLMWGEALVGSLDSWIDYATDFVLNPQPSEPIAPAFQRKELHRRAVFASMTPEQREVVVDLVRENAMSLMFSPPTHSSPPLAAGMNEWEERTDSMSVFSSAVLGVLGGSMPPSTPCRCR